MDRQTDNWILMIRRDHRDKDGRENEERHSLGVVDFRLYRLKKMGGQAKERSYEGATGQRG